MHTYPEKVVCLLIQCISSGYLNNIKVIEKQIKGLTKRTICITIEAEIIPKDLKKIIEKKLSDDKLKNVQNGIARNQFLKLISSKVDRYGDIYVSVQVLDNIQFPNSNLLKMKKLTVFADFFDSDGDHIRDTMTQLIDRRADIKMKNTVNESMIVKGMVIVLKFISPSDYKSYKLWLLND